MKLLLFLLGSAFLHGSLGARTPGALAEFSFLQKDCKDQTPFENTGNSAASGGDLASFSPFPKSFSCADVSRGDDVFVDASNGITANPGSGTSGVMSQNTIDTSVFGEATTFEFWLFTSAEDRTEQVLLEIGRDGSTGAFDNWEIGTDFDLRLSIVSGGSGKITYSDGLDINPKEVGLFDVIDLSLKHVVMILKPDSDNPASSLLESYVNGKVTATTTIFLKNSQFSFASENPRVVVGGSFDSRSNNPEDIKSFPGNIMHFAMYTRELTATEIQNNFDAGIPNNLPAVLPNTNFNKTEDVDVTFSLDPLLLDFDAEFVSGQSYNSQTVQVQIVSLPDAGHGTLLVNNKAIAQGDSFAFDTEFKYRQKVDNEDDFVDRFKFRAFDQNLLINASPEATVSITYIEADDPPVAQDSSFDVQEALTEKIKLVASEPFDGGVGKNPNNFPNSFTVRSIDNSEGNGLFFVCNDSTKKALEVGQVLEDVQTEDSIEFFVEICYEAAVFDESIDALLATDSISFIASDPELDSLTKTTTVRVLNSLSAGCTFIPDDDCEEKENAPDNGDFIKITLKGVDSRCDVADPDSSCSQRIKNFVLRTPLPDPEAEGIIKVLSEDGEEEIDVTEDSLDSDGEFLIPGGRDFIRFYPVDDYFNLAQNPICVRNAVGGEERGQCISQSGGPQICTGDFCDASFSETTSVTVSKNLRRYGKCADDDSDVIEDGCPIRLSYRLQIGTGKSPSTEETPTMLLWLSNVLDAEPGDSKIIGSDTYGPFVPKTDPRRLSEVGLRMGLDDPDRDAKLMRIIILPTNCRISVSIQITDIHPPDLNYLDYDGNLLVGQETQTIIDGFQTDLNALLGDLRLTLTKNQEGRLTMRLQSPLRINGAGVQVGDFVFTMTLDDDNSGASGGDDRNYTSLYAIIAFVFFFILGGLYGGFSVMKRCIGSACTNLRLFFVRSKRGKKTRRNRAYSENSSEIERLRKKRCSYRMARVCWRLGGPYLLVFICPCLFALIEEKTESLMGDSDDEFEERNIEEEEVNEEDWEKKEVKIEGRKVVTWVHLPTGKEQWKSPFGKSKRKKKFLQANKGSLERGEMRVRCKLFKQKSDVKRLSRDSESEADATEVRALGAKSNRKPKKRTQSERLAPITAKRPKGKSDKVVSRRQELSEAKKRRARVEEVSTVKPKPPPPTGAVFTPKPPPPRSPDQGSSRRG